MKRNKQKDILIDNLIVINYELNKFKSGIYWIKNLINNKLYIGSAKILKRRKRGHFNALIKNIHFNNHLQNAFNKYKSHNFVFEIIEICKTEKLIEREQYWLDTINPYYNICENAGSMLGFNHSAKTKESLKFNQYRGKFGKENLFSIKCYQYGLDGYFIKKWDSISDAYRKLNTKDFGSLIVRCLKGRTKTAHGYQWFYEYHGPKIKSIKIKSRGGVVDKNRYDKIKKLISLNKNITEIAEILNINKYSLRGFLFRHKELDKKIKKRRCEKRVPAVLLLLKSKKSIMEMSKILNMREKSLRGYIWHHSELHELYTKNQKENYRKIIQYDLNGKKINEFSSMNKASIITGCNVGGIYNCCHKIRNRAGSFVWRFEGDPFSYNPQTNTVFKKN